MVGVHAQRTRQHRRPRRRLSRAAARHGRLVDLAGENVFTRRGARDFQIARPPRVQQVEARTVKRLHSTYIPTDQRYIHASLEHCFSADIDVIVPVLETQQPRQVDRRLFEPVRARAQVEALTAPEVELYFEFGPHRKLHAQVAQVDHFDATVEVTGAGVLEAEAAARRDAGTHVDGVGDLDVRLHRRAGDVALHADNEP